MTHLNTWVQNILNAKAICVSPSFDLVTAKYARNLFVVSFALYLFCFRKKNQKILKFIFVTHINIKIYTYIYNHTLPHISVALMSYSC